MTDYQQFVASRYDAAQRCRDLLAQAPVFLDTESTSFHGVAVQVAVVDLAGAILLDSYVRPTEPISPQAFNVHGINDDDLKDAPEFDAVYPKLVALASHHPIVAYNSAFDDEIIANSIQPYNANYQQPIWYEVARTWCAMQLYAAFKSETAAQGKYQKLEQALVQCGLSAPEKTHSAVADAESVRRLFVFMAGYADAMDSSAMPVS